MNEIKILVVKPDEEPEVTIIENNLKTKQKIVDGCIEYTSRSYYPNVAFICNEEGKILGLTPNRYIGGDIIVGDFIIVGDDGSGEDISLTDEQILKYKKDFNKSSIKEMENKLSHINSSFDL